MSQDEWVTMTQAAKEIGVTLSKISRLASFKRISTRHDPYDERTKLVSLKELREIFPPRTNDAKRQPGKVDINDTSI